MSFNNQDALEALAQELKIDLFFNKNGVCDFVIDGAEVTLEGEPKARELRINAVVGPLADPEDPVALITLLHANFNGQGVGASSLGIDHESGEVVLGQSVNVAQLGDDGLAPVIEDFANYLMYWRQNLGRLVERARGGAAPQGEPLEGHAFVRV